MSAWVSCHGAGAIQVLLNTFKVTASEDGGMIRPTKANELTGAIVFPLPSPPPNTATLTRVAVDFSSESAQITEVAILSGEDELFRKSKLHKHESLTLNLSSMVYAAEQHGKGLALSIAVEFENVLSQLRLHSVGLEVALAPTAPPPTVKFESGTWNVTDVRPWNEPREQTQGSIAFSTVFISIPTVMVGMTGADVAGETSFRAKVYATDITSRGFVVHADTWSDTKLYSCGVSWMAIGF